MHAAVVAMWEKSKEWGHLCTMDTSFFFFLCVCVCVCVCVLLFVPLFFWVMITTPIKEYIQIRYFSMKIYAVGTKVLLMSTHYVCFCAEIRKLSIF